MTGTLNPTVVAYGLGAMAPNPYATTGERGGG